MRRKIPTFEEYMEMKERNLKSLHRIDEMANISQPGDGLPKNSSVVIRNEKDIQGIKTPHFHVLIYGRKVELMIDFKHIYKMTIWRTKKNYHRSWNGITDVRDSIIEWLDAETKITKEKGKTNLEVLIEKWNYLNTKQIDMDYVK